MPNISTIEKVLTRRVTNIIPNKEGLENTLKSKKKLNVYLGIDPTATKLHLGNAVPLRKLQEFVDLGHNVTFLIGDFTALIGDASDKVSERPILTQKEIEENFKTYKKQAEKIVDFSKAKVRQNSEWLKKLTFEDIISLTQRFSVGDFVNRELIRNRLTQGKRVRLDETLYPVMQGYDSYFMDTDIQIGGADQTFNMQAGRILQNDLRNKESFICVTGYLEGTDGRKMSKSWNNAIWIEDEPNNMFGKVMSIKDDLIIRYFDLATNAPVKTIKNEENNLKKGENPLDLKKRLAFQIVKELHTVEEARKSREFFENTFQKGQAQFTQKFPLGESLAGTIASFTHNKSISEAKRLISQGSVDVDGRTINDPTYHPQVGQKIQVGKRIFGIVSKPINLN